MSYKQKRPSTGGIDIPGANSIHGIGVLRVGTYNATVETIAGDTMGFAALPEGTHIEKLIYVPPLSRGDKVTIVIGLSKGAALRRNGRGEYALVNAQDKQMELTTWHMNVMDTLKEGRRILLASPSIHSITKDNINIYTNEEVSI